MQLVRLVPLTLDRDRQLCLDLPAIMAAERQLQTLHGDTYSILDLLSTPSTLTLQQLRIMLWAACLYEDPAVTLEVIFAGQPLSRLADYMRAFQDCLAASLMPRAGEAGTPAAESNGGDPLAGSTGLGSGPSGVLNLVSPALSGEG
jgi:hypothetical protein